MGRINRIPTCVRGKVSSDGTVSSTSASKNDEVLPVPAVEYGLDHAGTGTKYEIIK